MPIATGTQVNTQITNPVPKIAPHIEIPEVNTTIENNPDMGVVVIPVDLIGRSVNAVEGALVIQQNESVSLTGEVGTSIIGPLSPLSEYDTTYQISSGLRARALSGNINGIRIPKMAETVQSLSPSAILEFFVIDLTSLGDSVYYLHNGTNELGLDVTWQGQTYNPFPIFSEGYELTGQGSIPRPKIKIANISGLITVLIKNFGDMVGAKIIRKRTFARYLDSINFVKGNPTADPTEYLVDDVYYIDRKSAETRIFIEFELASVLDLNNVRVPRRQVIQNTCPWKYRDADCGWTGDPVATINDEPTLDPALDVCGKRLKSCKMRFGDNGVLRFGGFPGSGLLET